MGARPRFDTPGWWLGMLRKTLLEGKAAIALDVEDVRCSCRGLVAMLGRIEMQPAANVPNGTKRQGRYPRKTFAFAPRRHRNCVPNQGHQKRPEF